MGDINIKPFGVELQIDLYNCDSDFIRDKAYIANFATTLCEIIDMKPFGKPQVVRFGKDPRITGCSLVQLIETSLISGHFAEANNAAYINIFSCKPFTQSKAIMFCKKYFGAKHHNSNSSIRQ